MTPKGEIDTSFRSALRRLDDAGRVVKIAREVDTEFEVAGAMSELDGGPAVLFENVRGSSMPVLGNFLASERNVEAALAVDRLGVRQLMERGLAEPIPPEIVEHADVQQVVHTDDIDLGANLPVLRHAPGDGGRFITAGVVIARDPLTGINNASYHRMQLLGGSRTAIKLDQGRHLRTIWDHAKELGADVPLVVAIGPDLSLLYAAAFMGSQMAFETDELAAAGGVRGAPLRLAAGITQDLPVPADSEIVLEATMSTSETAYEGPFGEFLGYHSDEGPAPVVDVTALMHRTDPVYVAINGAGQETVMLRKHVLEAAAYRSIHASTPIVNDVHLTAGGLHRFHLVLSVGKRSPQHDGLQRNAAMAAFGALKDLDLIVLVDDDIDIHNLRDVEYAIATRLEASKGIVVVPGARGHEYIRASASGVRAKLIIDATVPYAEKERFQRIGFVKPGLAESEKSTAKGSAAVPWL